MPAEPEVLGLLALMLLADSRRDARVSSDGALVPLATQDRSRWDRLRIAEGQAIVRRCLQWNRPGPYQIQAAIQAVHGPDIENAKKTGGDLPVEVKDSIEEMRSDYEHQLEALYAAARGYVDAIV